jgi:hypothetical protein
MTLPLPPVPPEPELYLNETVIKEKTIGPAIGLMVTAGLGLLGVLYQAVMLLLTGFPDINETMAQLEELGMGENAQQMIGFLETFQSPAYLLTSTGFALVFSLMVLSGAFQMRQLRSWGFCVSASILAMLPCLSPCCVVGLPIGIWSLVVLFDD